MDDAKPFDIFRAGTHTAMSGVTLAFTESDLDATVAAYSERLHAAPIVVGHPRTDAPAYGWVRGRQRDGDRLQALPEQIDPDFAELVRTGRFKKVSASFYAPDSPVNPVPGAYYLRHVGFLGATPPAVKGLREAQFADAEPGVVTLELGEWAAREHASLWRRMREFFIGQFGLEKADLVIPSWSVEELEAEARAPAPEAVPDAASIAQPIYSEAAMPGQQSTETPDLAARAAELDSRQAEIDAREARLREAEVTARRKAHAEFADGLITQGRLLPRDREGLVAFMDALAPESELAFGEGAGAFKGSTVQWLRDFLAAAPVQVVFGEHAGAESPAAVGAFRSPPEHQVDRERLALHTKALAYQESHPGTTYSDAVLTVSQGV